MVDLILSQSEFWIVIIAVSIASIVLGGTIGSNLKKAIPDELMLLPLRCPENDLSCPAVPICPAAPACPDLACNCPNMTCSCPPEWVIEEHYTSHLQEVAASITRERPHEYKESWDCDDMAQEAKKRLRNAGYNCKVEVGEHYLNETDHITHQWVVCDDIIIEATNGEIVNGGDYWRYEP